MPLILELSFDQVQERWVFYKLHIVELSFSQNIRGKKLASIHPWRIRHELNLCCIQCKWNTLGGKLSWQCGPCDRWSVGHIWDSYRTWLDNVLHNSFCCSWCNRFRWWVPRIPRTFQLATCNLVRKLAYLRKWEIVPWAHHCRQSNAYILDDKNSCQLQCNRLWWVAYIPHKFRWFWHNICHNTVYHFAQKISHRFSVCNYCI